VIGNILYGWLYWRKIKIKYRIDYSKVVIVLSGENYELDRQVLVHLSDFVQRKHASSVIVLCKEEYQKEWTEILENDMPVSVRTMSDEKMKLLYSYYCFEKFFDNIVFTYIDTPRDNQLGIYLRKTDVNEEDAACLALYHLRCVPSVRR
jgi:hypothetical protein